MCCLVLLIFAIAVLLETIFDFLIMVGLMVAIIVGSFFDPPWKKG